MRSQISEVVSSFFLFLAAMMTSLQSSPTFFRILSSPFQKGSRYRSPRYMLLPFGDDAIEPLQCIIHAPPPPRTY
jgi:hypothetical protein